MIKQKKQKDAPVDFPSLSRKETLILEMLIGSGRELFGLEMVDASNGQLKRGTIYVTLQRMQDKGFIDSKQEPRPEPEIGIARRLYSPTSYGQRVYAVYQAARSALTLGFAEAK